MARGSILLGSAVCAQFTRAKLDTFASSAQCRSTKGNVSRDITHTQALLGALVKCFLKILVHKIIRRFYIFKMNSAKVRLLGFNRQSLGYLNN
jgi:hypothetical protein